MVVAADVQPSPLRPSIGETKGRADGPEEDGSRGTFAVLFLVVFLSMTGFGVVFPLLPFFAIAFDAQPWQIALMFAAYSGGQFAGELCWGPLSDRIGRRLVLLITVLGAMIGYLALAFAPNVWMALLIRFMAGAFAGNTSVINSFAVDVTTPDRLAARLGVLGSAGGLGFLVGPALGGLLARPDLGAVGFRPPLFCAALMCGLAIVGILIFVRAAKRPRARARSSSGSALVALGGALQDPVLLRAFGAIFFGYFAASALWSVLGLWLDNRFSMGPREIGLIMALTGMFVALAQSAVTGRLIRRIGAAATITAGLVFAAIFTLAMSLSPWVWLAVGTLTAGVMGQAVWQPASTSLVAANVGSDQRGALLGAAGASGCLARMLGPIAAGALFSAVAPTAPLIFASVMMLPGAWLAWRAGRAARSRQLARTLDAET